MKPLTHIYNGIKMYTQIHMYITQTPNSRHNLYKTLWIYVQRYIQIYTYTHNHTHIYMYIYTILLIQRSVNICAPLRFFIFEFILQCFVILIQAEPNIFWYILCSSWICVTKDAGSGYTCRHEHIGEIWWSYGWAFPLSVNHTALPCATPAGLEHEKVEATSRAPISTLSCLVVM